MSTAPSNYRHSETFAILKATKERIKTNLSTGQYLKTLDQYLLNAVVPIIEATCYYDVFLTKLLAWQTENFRRKLSMRPVDIPSLVMRFLLQDKSESKIEIWKELCLERGAVFVSLRSFLDSLKEYELACNCEGPVPSVLNDDPLAYYLFVAQHHEQALETTRPLMPIIQQVRYWLHEAHEFKNRIEEKYTRMCLTFAQKDYVSHFQCRKDLDVIVQCYAMAASRAIDKCDASQGVLTTHITNWFLTAKNHLTKELTNELQEVPLSALESVDTEGLNAFIFDMEDDVDRITHIRKIARMADLEGSGRILLGIEEHLPPATKNFLRSISTPMRAA
jgi:hypothetical protein